MAVESVPGYVSLEGGGGWTIPGTKHSTSYISFGCAHKSIIYVDGFSMSSLHFTGGQNTWMSMPRRIYSDVIINNKEWGEGVITFM